MNILVPNITIAEKVLRAGVVYAFLLVAFRLCGKRQLGQLTAFDLVVLLLISNVLQNAMIGNDNSLGGGIRDLRPALRHHGVASRRDIRYAFLEEDGRVSVVTRRPAGE